MGNKTFNLQFDEAVAHFRDKLNIPAENWKTLQDAEHAKGFMVAGAMKADLIADFRGAVDKAVAGGMDKKEFLARFDEIVAKHGWQYNGERKWRSDLIWSTNLNSSYQAGRWQQFKKAGVKMLTYRHMDGIKNPRPDHVSWDGVTLPINHPWWQTHFPPSGFRCHCVTVMADGQKPTQEIPPGEPDEGWNYNVGEAGLTKGHDILNKALGRLEGMGTIGKDVAEGIRKEIAGKVKGVVDVATVEAVPVFEAQKTAKAAGEWAVKNGFADFADYSGIKPEVANEWNKSLFDHLQEFPELRKNQKFIGTSQGQMAHEAAARKERYIVKLTDKGVTPQRAVELADRVIKAKRVPALSYAQSWENPDAMGIAINKKWGASPDDFKAAISRDVATKFHPPGGDSIKFTVDHELGHQLDDLLKLHVDTDIISAYNKAKTIGMTEEVSTYAGTNIKEFIAECWGESCNSPSPRPNARRVSEIVRSRYESLFGKAGA